MTQIDKKTAPSIADGAVVGDYRVNVSFLAEDELYDDVDGQADHE